MFIYLMPIDRLDGTRSQNAQIPEVQPGEAAGQLRHGS